MVEINVITIKTIRFITESPETISSISRADTKENTKTKQYNHLV